MTKYKLCWTIEDKEWSPGEQHSYSYYCNSKIDLMECYQQALTEKGYNFKVYVRRWNQFCLTNIKLKGHKE